MKDTNPLLVDSNNAPRTSNKTTKSNSKRIYILIGIIIIILLAVCVGLLVYFLDTEDEPSEEDPDQFFESRFLEIPSNNSCYNFSQSLAYESHIAGERQTFILADIFASYLEEYGYQTYRDNINPVVLDHWINSSLHINGIKIDISNENFINDTDTNSKYRFAAWNAFSSSGNHTGQLLYVNNAQERDFQFLIHNLSINFTANTYIGLAKRGSRANQANVTAFYGLKGLILFENSYNFPNETYPNGPKLPDKGFGYGRIRYNPGCPGNPYPDRLESVCGYNISNYDDLFPALKNNLSMITISSYNAIEMFKLMNNDNNYNDSRCDYNYSTQNIGWNWETNLNLPDEMNVCIGGTNKIITNLYVNNDFNMNDTIQNVYGFFNGTEYPDEIIMIGAHRDAWGLGACDDISGTVTILEIARSLSVLRDKYNWKPKRSLMFGSWDGEEWGLYGSVDFNEQTNQTNPWIDKVIAYLNFDMTVVGGRISLQGNPILRELLLDAGKQVKYPYQNNEQYNNNPDKSDEFTIYDTWWNFADGASNNLPLTATNSDFGGFEYFSGIPCIGAGFYTETAYTYHTFYDLNGWLDIVDPKWDFAKSIAQYGGLIMLKLTENDILPFDLTRLGLKLEEWAQVDLPNHANSLNCVINETLWTNLEFASSLFSVNSYVFKGFIDDNQPNNENPADTNMGNITKINNILKHMMGQLTLSPDNDSGDQLISNPWYNQLIWTPSKRYPYIWDTISNGCNQDNIQLAFNLTIQYVRNAALLIQYPYD